MISSISSAAWVPSSIQARLMLLLGVAVSMVALVGALGWYGTRSGDAATRALYDQGVKSVSTMGELRDAFGKMARYEMDMLVNFESPPLTDQAKASWVLAHKQTLQNAQALQSAQSHPEAAALLAALLQGIARYKVGLDQLIPKLERGEVLSAGVGNQLMLEHRVGFQAAAGALDQLQKLVQDQTSALRDQASARAQSLIAWAIAVAAGGIAATLAIGTLMIRAVRSQIQQAGELTARIASGDLRAPPLQKTHGADEIGLLMASLDRMQAELNQLVSGVHRGANSIASASVQISEGSAELSHRTELSASDLQSMAITLGELDAFAAQSSAGARNSLGLANAVADKAKSAATAASNAARSMHLIEGNARKISDITVVMDSIAFQTNMLAINAAVEASHAGQHGRGFGVVAHEIQILARRSAAAANDIKILLKDSNASVLDGVAAVGAADQAVGSIAEATQQMTQGTSELSDQAASLLQRIAQINEGARRVEDITLQNSALSEESTAAAQSLKEQALRLSQLVEVFKI